MSDYLSDDPKDWLGMGCPTEPPDLKPKDAFDFWAYDNETAEELREAHDKRLGVKNG